MNAFPNTASQFREKTCVFVSFSYSVLEPLKPSAAPQKYTSPYVFADTYRDSVQDQVSGWL